MDGRRKEVGKKIQQARRRADYKNQADFADAIGKHETSIANAERGSERVGAGVWEAIEDGLNWPLGSIELYIAGNGPAPWDDLAVTQVATAIEAPAPDDWTPEERERVRGMTVEEIITEGQMIGKYSGEEAQLRYLRTATSIKLDLPVNFA